MPFMNNIYFLPDCVVIFRLLIIFNIARVRAKKCESMTNIRAKECIFAANVRANKCNDTIDTRAKKCRYEEKYFIKTHRMERKKES